MESIRREICINDSKSHKDGLLPYICFNSDDNIIKTVNSTSKNGNYNQYVCDLTIVSAYTVTENVFNDTIKLKPISSITYTEAIRKYNFIENLIENGVFLKRFIASEVKISNINCISGITTSSVTTCEAWTENFSKKLNKYDFIPLDEKKFYNNGMYYKLFSGTCSSEYIVLLKNFDLYEQYEKEWSDWITYFKTLNDSHVFEDQNPPVNFRFCQSFEKYIIGRVLTPLNITISGQTYEIKGDKVPTYVSYVGLPKYLEWFDNNVIAKDSDKKIKKEWDDRGGYPFYNYLKRLVRYWQNGTNEPTQNGLYFQFTPPKVNMSLLLTENINYNGLCYPYEYSIRSEFYQDGSFSTEEYVDIKEYVAPTSGVGSALTPSFVIFDNEDNIVETKLDLLRSPKSIQLTEDIIGVFESFSGYTTTDDYEGALFKCVYHINSAHTATKNCYQIVCVNKLSGNTYEWWECEYISNSAISNTIICANGENISANSEKYANITILSCINDAVINDKKDNDYYYFMVKYNNGSINWMKGDDILKNESHTIIPLRVPYEKDVVCNQTSLEEPYSDIIIYDKVTDKIISASTSSITFTYAIGLTSGMTENNNGIHYKEKMYFEPYRKKNIIIDGIYEAEIYYEYIDDSALYKHIYNKDINMYRDVRQAVITKMEIGTQWTSQSAIKALLFTKDELNELQDIPRYKAYSFFDRGAASAWEKRYKLAECNSLEDLENYGNNYFKI